MNFKFSGRRGLYRSRSGMILGVCKGLANYFDFSVVWIRILALVAFIFSGLWPAVIVYIIAALVMKREPMIEPMTESQEEFYRSYAGSRGMAVNRLKRTYSNLERRLRRLEDAVTSPGFDWQGRA